MCMIYPGYLRRFCFSLPLYEDANSYPLLNVKNILILCTNRRSFFLLAVAMQIKNIYLIETLHQTLTHSPKSGIIQVAMIGDEGENAITRLLNAPLSKSDKLYIIVIKPFRIALSQ